jgi:diguanylate cyclase (GGDEF)-like protein
LSEQRIQVLLAEKSRSLAGLVTGYLEEANFRVHVSPTVEEALEVLQQQSPEVLVSTVARFDGELLCRKVRKLRLELPIALIYPPSRTRDVARRGMLVGADLVLPGPVQRSALVSGVRLLIRLGRLTEQLYAAESTPVVPEQDFRSPDMETFKRILAMEVKKSRRYRHPVSFLMLEIDNLSQRNPQLDKEARVSLVANVQLELLKILRDIDVCVHTGNDRFLVFLPHTPYSGARVVAERMHARVKKLLDPPLSASIGVSAYDGHGAVSHGSLLRDATVALTRAKEAGGDRVEATDPKKPDRVFIA